MITFKQFLNEGDNELGDFTPEQAAEKIKKDCAKFLEESRFKGFGPQHELYRGIKAELPAFHKNRVEMNRQPKDTSKLQHETLNEYFMEQFGINYRSNAFFATSSCSLARDYGCAYIIFPIGNYQYIWSEQIRDAYLFFDAENREFMNDYHEIFGHKIEYIDHDEDSNNRNYCKAIKQYLEKTHPYKDTNLSKAIDHDSEIMIHCENYYTLYYGKSNRAKIDFTKEVLDLL
jgi:hypothetical protein